jgi:restriction system protein
MIPDFQTLMLPLLKFIADEKNHSTKESVTHLANEFNLTEQELNEWLPSKVQKVFYNRVHWAKAHLKMADLIENVNRGIFRITKGGKQILLKKPERITVRYLSENVSNYKNSIEGNKNKEIIEPKLPVNFKTIGDIDIIKETPEEQIESGYKQIRQSLEAELLSKLKLVHPAFFEKVVVELLVKMGYGGSIAEAGKATRYTNDEGIDGVIKEDKLGLDVIYIQAKRWEGVIGRPELHKFVGALAGQGAKKGVFITTSYFSKDAFDYMPRNDTKIVLIDGVKLAQYMIDYNLGVSIQNTYEIKKMDSDYFEED